MTDQPQQAAPAVEAKPADQPAALPPPHPPIYAQAPGRHPPSHSQVERKVDVGPAYLARHGLKGESS
jgi:hypothetical protein